MAKRRRTYALTIEAQDGGYLAYFPALVGCATWGTTYEETIRNAREACIIYLESHEAIGLRFPKERTNERIFVGLSAELPIIT